MCSPDQPIYTDSIFFCFVCFDVIESELEELLYAGGHITESQYRYGHIEKSRSTLASLERTKKDKNKNSTTRKRNYQRMKLTNTHLMGQYEWFKPEEGKTKENTTGAQKK